MPDVLFEVPIAATPDRVYTAITEKAGLERWWSAEVVSAEPRVGSATEVRFRGGAFVIKLEVAGLEPLRTVAWNMRQGAPEWAGTSVTWELAPMDAQHTRVRFSHRGYPSVNGSFATVNFSWGFYLSSLRDYLEKGQGRPGQL
jgi:uncharacterized protein YndB with AHSA1/START domain